jgi:hypothetical protein
MILKCVDFLIFLIYLFAVVINFYLIQKYWNLISIDSRAPEVNVLSGLITVLITAMLIRSTFWCTSMRLCLFTN